jgi:hypothetical protein
MWNIRMDISYIILNNYTEDSVKKGGRQTAFRIEEWIAEVTHL